MPEIKSPRIYVDELLAMAREFERIGNALVALKVKKATEILSIRARAEIKSDAQAERIWNATPDGILELQYTFQLKSLEKLMSAIKSKLKVLSDERFSQY